jgi:hypothetical protein
MMLLDVSVLPKKKKKVQKHFILIRLSLSGEGAIFLPLVVLRKIGKGQSYLPFRGEDACFKPG